MKTSKNIFILGTILIVCAILLGCSSVFTAGITGRIVDSESNSLPKEGIQNVEVYAYTSYQARDADLSCWSGNGKFMPTNTNEYFGHAITDTDGNFSISKVAWESFFPKYGKTADCHEIFFLFYHEDYGLVKNSDVAMVLSDSTASTVYQEVTKIRLSTNLTVNIKNIATESNIDTAMNAYITVPQSGTDVKVYEQAITGSNTIRISYPRYLADGETENTPTISIKVSESSSNIKWKQCNYVTTAGSEDYSFMSATSSGAQTVISGKVASADAYVKARKISMPTIKGQYNTSGDEYGTKDDDGKIITAQISCDGGTTYSKIGNSVSTEEQNLGSTSGKIRHGTFSGLCGADYFWIDDAYTEKTASAKIKFKVDGNDAQGDYTITSDMTDSLTVQLK